MDGNVYCLVCLAIRDAGNCPSCVKFSVPDGYPKNPAWAYWNRKSLSWWLPRIQVCPTVSDLRGTSWSKLVVEAPVPPQLTQSVSSSSCMYRANMFCALLICQSERPKYRFRVVGRLNVPST